MLSRYLYLSHAVPAFGRDELHDLVARSAAANTQYGITGLLVFSSGHFMQVVEGSPGAIAQLRANIEADTRHTHLTELRHSPAPHRLFEGWSLASNLPDAYEGLSLQVARHLARLQWNDEDLEVLAMLGRFWSDFGEQLERVQAPLPVWKASVLKT